ncbi:MAG: penicillin-binding protein 1C [Raineya sp.]|jgi:penicillin-binding protein 1C|nr:penicillin-binding protein 1C [Raineya sp.]
MKAIKLNREKVKKIIKNTLISIVSIFFLFIILDTVFPFKINISYSQLILDRDGKVLGAFLSRDDKWRMKTELSEISSELKNAFLEKEDKYFHYHFGVNPVSLTRAFFNNIIANKRTSGASTITMQVARLLEPKKRTYFNKLIEVFRAFQLEWHYSKDEILQMYINLVPYGSNIEGVKSASVIYFGSLPQKLSPAQITTLALIPNRPTSLALGKDNPEILKERNKWLKRLGEANVFNKKELENALIEPLGAKRQEIPKIAPHLSQRIIKSYPQKENIYTTIQINTQIKVQSLATNYSRRMSKLNIRNVAILVIKNSTLEIEAYVGSQDFNDKAYQGQVDGVTAIRSPGSTLKPLVYALGMDLGKLTPKTTIADIPTNWQGYAPDNFDKKFRGKISIEEALSHSLNIPAVEILNQITVPIFVEKLSKAGFKNIAKRRKDMGLSMILGGCGVSLEEIAGLYTIFSHQGEYQPLRFIKNDTTKIKTVVISPISAYSIAQTLTLANRPDLPKSYEQSLQKPAIAWKTGTSYGRRDAWSVGFNQDYTVAVWVGNFTGEGVPELTGSEIATPLLFDVFNNLPNTNPKLLEAPQNIQFRLVCAESGLPPNEFCTNQVTDYYIPLISPSQTCQHLKEYYVSADEKFIYLPDCLPQSGYKKKMYPNLSANLLAYYESEKIPYEKTPVLHADCGQYIENGQSDAPQIISPVDKKVYIIPEKNTPDLLLKAYIHNDSKKIYWYLDDKLYKEISPQENAFFRPSLGKTKITCVDEKGRSMSIEIMVEYE